METTFNDYLDSKKQEVIESLKNHRVVVLNGEEYIWPLALMKNIINNDTETVFIDGQRVRALDIVFKIMEKHHKKTIFINFPNYLRFGENNTCDFDNLIISNDLKVVINLYNGKSGVLSGFIEGKDYKKIDILAHF
ncbi:hypothetical protein S875_004470 [Salmonella enterica]|uniref:Uncharacterized protein n=1 Tax=Salmonella enterica TaxID=28901 RepID=A0A743XK20_SALER|nr:hypothetical protein [Salmonella enterica]EAW8715947.1 hypothetical protein [Salmonella enterica]EAX1585623.1 hypothetical protein [Salmonella enterica]EAX3254116.1 hypothetical protein [Salmonella enterica]EAY5566426.1 hypothetical protein [Salmonella enterica]EBO9646466.1 hypothetical protein [Salmonella enterica]